MTDSTAPILDRYGATWWSHLRHEWRHASMPADVSETEQALMPPASRARLMGHLRAMLPDTPDADWATYAGERDARVERAIDERIDND